jgi:hypothetical protein
MKTIKRNTLLGDFDTHGFEDISSKRIVSSNEKHFLWWVAFDRFFE